MMKTDEEVLDWVISEFERANSIQDKTARKVRYRAKVIFDKRFPNPES
jgi:hypothetical protein